jgi:hypothetical protein
MFDFYRDHADALQDRCAALEERIVVLEALTQGMGLPDELEIHGQTYVKKGAS